MSTNVLSKKQQYFVVAFAAVLSLLVVWSVVSGATTISTNISTGGTLTVSGDSSLVNASTSAMLTVTGGFISSASSTVAGVFNVNGATDLNSTLNVDGLSTLAGYISTASSTAVSSLNVRGALNASTTLQVTGLSTLTGYLSTASSTVSANLSVRGPLSASSTLNVGDILTATSTATTTIALHADSNTEGGCIQLRGANGINYRMYVGAGELASVSTTSPRSSVAYFALWEVGTCQ